MLGNLEERSGDVDPELGRVCADALKRKMMSLPQESAEVFTWENPSIRRVSPDLRDHDPRAFDPKVVSIGPLHRGKNELLDMEKVKMENLRHLLSKNADFTLENLFCCVFRCLTRAGDEYSEKATISDIDFAEMLVLDGLFIISLFAWEASPALDRFSISVYYRDQWADLLLLENQIPFFVIKELFEVAKSSFRYLEYEDPNLISSALRFLRVKLPQEKFPQGEVKHLLHLKHLSLDPLHVEEKQQQQQTKWEKAASRVKEAISMVSLPFLGLLYLISYRDFHGLFGFAKQHRHPLKVHWASATDLLKEGVSLTRKTTRAQSERTFDLCISFRDGTLEIPSLFLTESTFDELRNLIAFEQYNRVVPLNFTSYYIFLSRLMQTAADVAILRRSQILKSEFLSDGHVVEMFNIRVKKLDFWGRKNCFEQVYEDLSEFCKLPHHRWRASLLQNYFSSPWTTLSVIGACLLLLFSGIQTSVALSRK